MSIQERYQPSASLLHQVDPRLKIVVSGLFIIGIMLTPERAWPAYPLLWALLGSLAEIGHVGVMRLNRTAFIALPFALAAVTVTFTTPGQEVVRIVGLTITDAGLSRFLSIMLKSWLATQTALLLAMTTPFTSILWALSSLRVPKTLVMIFAFTYRYLFILIEEAKRLTRARTARSATSSEYKSGRTLIWRARVAGGMIGSLFIRSYERGERVYLAMRARGYAGQMRLLTPPRLTARDTALSLIPLLLLLVIELLAFIFWSR